MHKMQRASYIGHASSYDQINYQILVRFDYITKACMTCTRAVEILYRSINYIVIYIYI